MGKEPLGDYFQSHVVILVKYLNILREKTMDKVIQRKLKKERKERKDKWAKRVVELGEYNK